MDYNKLVWNLRKKAFNYEGEKSTQFDRVLKEAIKRKVIAYSQTDEFLLTKMKKDEKLLFRTR